MIAEFGPHEIKTLFVPDDRALPAVETDLLEGPLSVCGEETADEPG